MNVKKPVEFDHFEPGEAMKWVRCPKCERAVNVYGTPKHEPLTFGSATDKPEVMTHWCLVHCRCKATTVKVYGRLIKMTAYGCMAFPTPTPQAEKPQREGACLDPEKMKGAEDGFGGSDYP